MKGFTVPVAGDGVRVLEAELDGAHGLFDQWTGEIKIDPRQPETGKHVVLVHEALHMVEAMLLQAGVIKGEVEHEFIINAAPLLLLVLAAGGFHCDVTTADLMAFMDGQTEETP